MVESELVEDGGLEVVDGYGVADDVVREVVCFAKGHAGFHAAACHED